MRSFLYSKWFFAFLAIVCALDLAADIGEHLHPERWTMLNTTAIVLDAIAVVLTLWMFIDLHRRRPKHGRNPGSGR